MLFLFRLIEKIRCEDISYMVRKIFLLRIEDCLDQKTKVCDRSEVSRKSEFLHIVCLCARAHGEYEITDMNIFGDRSCRAYTDQFLYSVSLDELVGVNSDRRASHSRSHDGNRFITVKSGITEHISCGIKLSCSCKEILSDKFCTERIARK